MTDDMPGPKSDEMISTKEVGKMLGVTSKTVIRMIENGQLDGYRVSFVWRIKRGDVEAYLDAHKFRPDQPQGDE